MTRTPNCAEDEGEASDVGVNDLGDSEVAISALRRSQLWEAEAGSPAGASLVLAAGGRQDWRNTTDCKSNRST